MGTESFNPIEHTSESLERLDAESVAAAEAVALLARKRARVIFRVASSQQKTLVRRIEHTVDMRRVSYHLHHDRIEE